VSDIEIHHLGAAYALDALDERELAAFEAHYRSCDVCRADVADFRAAATALATSASAPPPAGLRDKVLAEIGTTRQQSPLVPGVVDLRARRLRRRWLTGLAAAAAAVVVFMAGVVVSRHDDRPSGYADALASVLARPDSQVVTLGRTEAAGGGADGGTVKVAWSDERDSAVLLADGLSPAPSGRAYELWLIGDAGPVPMHVLDPASGGRLRAVVDIDAAPHAWGVTIEPAAGSPQPTGPILFQAQA
jgi:anti-sigma-K factor RskA